MSINFLKIIINKNVKDLLNKVIIVTLNPITNYTKKKNLYLILLNMNKFRTNLQ